MLRVDCRGEDAEVCERVELLAPKASDALREDAVTRTLNGESGDAIALGEVAVGEQQTVKLVFKQLPSARAVPPLPHRLGLECDLGFGLRRRSDRRVRRPGHSGRHDAG